MVYTVTLNPSLDYYVQVNNLKTGIVNRATSEHFSVGGKGVNVSLALKELEEETCALGFYAGFTGDAIVRKMTELGLPHQFIPVQGITRINVKIKSTTETDINATGVLVTQQDLAKLMRRLKKNLKECDWVVISGSLPQGLNNQIYADLVKKLRTCKGIKVVVDACGELLTNTLPYHPFLIKPNIYELCEIFNLTTIPDIEGLYSCARKLQAMGALNVIISMGSSGAVMVTENNMAMYVRAARGQLVNSVGAGDSMIAGFIHEFNKSNNYFLALNYATAAGSACAFTRNLANRAQIEYVESLML